MKRISNIEKHSIYAGNAHTVKERHSARAGKSNPKKNERRVKAKGMKTQRIAIFHLLKSLKLTTAPRLLDANCPVL